MKKQLFLAGSVFAATLVSAVDTQPTDKAIDPAICRSLWQKRTQGKNLALGKKVTFSIPNNYRLTNSESDPYDLTDGKLSTNKKDLIWFGKDAVGWFGGVSDSGVNFQIDLGKEENVDKLVIRCLGGEVQKTLGFPKSFEVFVSRDGKNYYRTAHLTKLSPAEKDLSDFKNNYFLEQNGKAYVYPFELKINAKTRYVAFTIASAAGGLFADELAVIEGNPRTPGFNDAYKTAPLAFHTKGLLLRPRLDEFAVPENINAPNFFMYRDMRTPEQKKLPLMLELDLPAQVKAVKPLPQKQENYKAKDGSSRVKMTFTVQKRPWSASQLQPMFFKADAPIPAGSKAVFTSWSTGIDPIHTELPVRSFQFKAVPKLKKLNVSLAWMGDQDARYWPDFFKSWETIGFNGVNGFPRYFYKKDDAVRNAFFDQVRKRGMSVIMTDSPIHAMPGKDKKGHEMNCLVPNMVAVCPSYRGKFYQAEIQRIKNCVIKSKPDIVYFDIEAWYRSHMTAKKCPRCLEKQKASGLPMDEFTKRSASETVRDFTAAVADGAKEVGIKVPPVGLYGMDPVRKDLSQPVLHWPYYSKYIAFAQPSLYVGERPLMIQDRIRKIRKVMKPAQIIPWLTAGTYGEIRPEFVGIIALEALLNGAGGFTYYAYWDFDTPRDFQYLAEALSMIAPYEDIIMEGTPVNIPCSEKGIYTSAVAKGKKMLVLTGNYESLKDTAVITLPCSKIKSITDLQTGKKIKPAKQLKLNVKRAGFRLLLVQGE